MIKNLSSLCSGLLGGSFSMLGILWMRGLHLWLLVDPWITYEFMLKRWLRMGQVKTKHVIRELGLWALGSGGGTGYWVQSHDQWFNQSCLCAEIPRKTQWHFLVGEHINMPGDWCILILEGKSMEPLCSGPSQTSLYVSLHLSRSNFFFYNKTVLVSIGLSWVLWAVLANSEEVLGNSPDL